MSKFTAPFIIIDEQGCPFYNTEDRMTLTDKAVILPAGKPSCLILVRQITELLFELLPAQAVNFSGLEKKIYSCGGCTGLIKFRLNQLLVTDNEADFGEPVVSGRVDAILPAELLQVFHMHQKTGKLLLDFESGTGRVTFREGALIAARYEDLDNREAIYAMLAEKSGYFRFFAILPEFMDKSEEVGDFMMILMEGLKRMDEVDY